MFAGSLYKCVMFEGSLYKDVCWKLEERGNVGETLLHVCLLNATSIHADLAKRLLHHYPGMINDFYISNVYYGRLTEAEHMLYPTHSWQKLQVCENNGVWFTGTKTLDIRRMTIVGWNQEWLNSSQIGRCLIKQVCLGVKCKALWASWGIDTAAQELTFPQEGGWGQVK